MAAAALATPLVPREFRQRPLHDQGYDSDDSVAAIQKWIDSKAHADWTAAEKAWAKRGCRRFLRAHRGDQTRAQENMQSTLEWRRHAVKPEAWAGRYTKDQHEFCFVPLGLDNAGRPVVYGSPCRASNRDVPATVDHVIMEIEHAFSKEGEIVPSPGGVVCDEQWVWCVDFNGFGFGDLLNPEMGRRFVSVFDSHFPERLGCLLLLDPPIIFTMLLAAVRPFMDAATTAKIVTVSRAAARDRLAGVFPSEMLDWIVAALGMSPTPGNVPFPLPTTAYWSHPDAEAASKPPADAPA
jgi:hypothetical protein